MATLSGDTHTMRLALLHCHLIWIQLSGWYGRGSQGKCLVASTHWLWDKINISHEFWLLQAWSSLVESSAVHQLRPRNLLSRIWGSFMQFYIWYQSVNPRCLWNLELNRKISSHTCMSELADGVTPLRIPKPWPGGCHWRNKHFSDLLLPIGNRQMLRYLRSSLMEHKITRLTF